MSKQMVLKGVMVVAVAASGVGLMFNVLRGLPLPGAAPAIGAEPPAWEAANPIIPLPKPPLGISGKLEDLPNAPTPQSVRLGKWLFYDTRLSADGSISCASCHMPDHAFSEPNPVSTGIGGQKGGRKAPGFANQAWTLYPHFFWDGRAASLEEQAKGPIINPIEMGFENHDVMISNLQKVQGYKPYFKEVFGDEQITIDRIAKAIADYERTRFSGNSKWDRWMANPDEGDAKILSAAAAFAASQTEEAQADEYAAGEAVADPLAQGNPFKDGKDMTAKAKWGHVLFHGKAGCNQCHLGQNFTDSLFHNLGVGWDAKAGKFKDEGRIVVSKKEEDMGAFKTPTVRDARQRLPLMHDGSVKSLREVVDLYNRGGEANPHLSPKIKPLNLTEDEINALVAFMEALEGEGYKDTAPASFPK